MRRALSAAVLVALALPATATGSFIEEGSFDIAAGGPYDVAVADFNGDGRPDIATMNGDSGSLSLLLRGAGGGFALEGSPTSFGAGAGGYGTVADFNGDARPDVALGLGLGPGNVSVLLRNPGSGFTLDSGSPRPFPSSSVNSVGSGDFNGDGRPDLAVLHGSTDSVSILLRNGVGDNFEAPFSFASGGDDPRGVAVGDVNGDGDPDLVVSHVGSGTARVFLGGADGTFALSGAAIAVGGSPFRVVLADFNHDARPDFAVASCTADAISVQLQQPGGGFAAAPPVPAGDCPIGLVTADFNFDGRADLAAANQSSSNVTVVLGNGAGGFAPDEGSPVRTDLGATGIASGDFDGDTRPDLAVSTILLDVDRVTVLLNRTPFPPGPPPPPGPVDADGDGVISTLDCDDGNPAIKPGATDIPGNKIDEDCDQRDAPLPLLKRRIRAITATYPSGYMTFTSMSVTPAREGDRLRLTCKGRGCDFKRKAIRIKKHAGKRSLMKQVGDLELRKGAVVQLRVTRAGTIGRARTWRVRAPKIPKIEDRCVSPGVKKLVRCPRG